MTDTPRPTTGELIDAVRENNMALAKRLLQEGAFVDERGEFNKTPLAFAVTRALFEMTELLINAGAKINVKNDLGSSLVASCIRNMAGPAYEEASAKILRLLIHKGAPLDNADQYGATALQLAREQGTPRGEKMIDIALRTRERYAKLVIFKAESARLLAGHNIALKNQAYLKTIRVKKILQNKPAK
jgi:ankyrin repeat protein